MPHLYKPSTSGDSLLYAWFPAMHSRVDLLIFSNQQEEELLHTVEAVKQELQRLEDIGNCFNPLSELSSVNHNAALRPLKVSPTLYDMLTICKQYHEHTEGLFDISIASEHHGRKTLSAVELQADHHVFFSREHIYLNLSGFLKGYALDHLRPLLEEKGIGNALINAGNSSILAIGPGNTGNGWPIALPSTPDRSITLRDQCLTTSGNESELRKHVVNPLTGLYVTGKRTVSVITESGTEGEVLSTSCFIANETQQELLHKNFTFKIAI